MKAQSLRITGMLLSLSISLATVLSCQQAPSTQGLPSSSNSTLTRLQLDTGHGQIRLNVALPQPKIFPALQAYHDRFHTQALEENRINRIKVTIVGVTTEFIAEKIIPISQGGMTATIKVPLGKNFLLTVQGMDDLNEVPGARVKGVFSVESAEVTPDVDVTPLTTAVAEVVERVRARDPEAAKLIDIEKLKNLITEGKSAASPFLVNFDAFADVIVLGGGSVPSIVPSNPVTRPGNISGTLTGLEPGDTAIVFSNDPVSEPFIVVAPPRIDDGDDTNDDEELEVPFRIDNVPPGEWVVRVVAAGYRVEGDTIESINEVSATKTAEVDADQQTELDFEVQKAGWSPTPINATGNIGSSDQPDAMADGSDNIHMVWRQDGFQENEEAGSVMYSRWNGRTWSTSNNFVSPPGDNKFRGAREPAVAVGTDRTPHVVWSANSNNADFRGRRIVFSRFDGTNWSEPLVISTTFPTTDVGADTPDVAINPINGQAYAVWTQLNNGVKAVFISQLQNGQWLDPIRLSQDTTASVNPIVSVGTDGWIRVAWEVENTSRAQYIEWDGKEFSPIEEIPFNQSASGERPRNLAGSVDRFNRLHLIRRVDNTIQYLFRSNNSWSKPEYVHEVASEALPVLSDASLALDSVGNVNAAWGSSLVNGTQVIRFRRRTSQGWDLPEGVGTNASATPLPFPTPTPQPTATSPPQPSGSPSPTPFPGFDDLPNSFNMLNGEEPQVVVDSRSRLSILWSNSASRPADSDVYHSLRAEPIEDTP
ncbi:MAG: hypothetical protein ACO1RX_06625 [Candidatus Sericytochromatia bacterium]